MVLMVFLFVFFIFPEKQHALLELFLSVLWGALALSFLQKTDSIR